MPKCFVGEPFCAVFQKIPVAKKLKDNRVGVSKYSVENFFPHSAENFRRGVLFSVSIISGIEKVWLRLGGEYQNLPSKFVCLTVPIISVEENPLVFQFFSGIKKI